MTELATLSNLYRRNSAFSAEIPGMQLAVDSTSLGEFKSCPRKYQLTLVEGWSPRAESPHLTFGIMLHKAREAYDHAKVAGKPHQSALEEVLLLILKLTWNSELRRGWLSDHPQKNRASLVQSVVWYLDKYGDNDNVETITLTNGKPAAELSFRFDSGLRTKTSNEPLLLCGHLDRIGRLGSELYICDIKSTAYQLTPSWSQGFSPDNQFSLYSLAGKVAFGYQTAGLILDGIQVGATFARMQRFLVPRSEAQLDEWFHDTSLQLRLMEMYALEKYWPMNDKSCSMYGGCKFRGVCSAKPSARAALLKSEFVQKVWNPLQIRGDI